ncbi:MAG: antibiotic biosynthesis monooxygenase family protein [Reyranellales bacterium]
MIVRIWRGQASNAKADAYVRHLTETVIPSLKALPGHCGAWVLRREVDGHTEFLAMTLWESLEAIQAFAGTNVDVANVESEARAVLSDFDEFARHYEVAFKTP